MADLTGNVKCTFFFKSLFNAIKITNENIVFPSHKIKYAFKVIGIAREIK